jgi:RNA polymerase sigma factor (sigma-70 family)
MGRTGLSRLLHQLHASAAAPGARDLTDGELLGAYCTRQDQAAFAALVRRHGPLVLAVCGRVLRHPEDREDAFQATFLALARDAASVRKRGSVAGWLHGVARHVALSAVRAAARRHRHEGQAMTTAAKNPAWEAAWREVQAVLDEEVLRLPERYREPFVLCCLENQGRAEAAARLGLKEGTVGSRLAEARRRLRKRLALRGVELAAVVGTMAVAADAAAARVPAALAAAVTRTAARVATGHALAPGSASARVLCLARGVPKAMPLTRVAAGAALLLVTALLGSAAGAVAYRHATPPAVARRQAARAAPADRPEARAAKGARITWKEGAALETPGWLPVSVAYSSDGKVMTVGGTGGTVAAFDAATRNRKWKAGVGGDFAAVAYSADGTSVLAAFPDGVRFLDAGTGKAGGSLEEKGSSPTAVGVFPDQNLVAGGGQKLSLHRVIFANRRGCFVKSWVGSAAPGTISLSTSAGGRNPAGGNAVPLAVDPGGTGVIVTGPVDRDTGKNVLWAWVAGNHGPGSPGNRLLKGHEAVVVSAAWSGDGKTAVTGDAAGRVIVWDARTMKEARRLELGGRVAAVAVSADGRNAAAVAVGKRAEFYAWEARKSGKPRPIHVDSSDFSGPVHACLAFSPDGRQLAGSAMSTAWLSRLGRLVGRLHVWSAAGSDPGVEGNPARQ